jgi:hypothetical protein
VIASFLSDAQEVPQKTEKTNPNAFCSGVASSSGTPMLAYLSALVSTAASTRTSARSTPPFSTPRFVSPPARRRCCGGRLLATAPPTADADAGAELSGRGRREAIGRFRCIA